MKRLLHLTERAFLGAGIILFAAMLVVVWLQIFSRYIVKSPLPWTEEAGRFLFVWTSLIGAAVLVGRDEHFQIDLLVCKMPPTVRQVLRVGVMLLVTAFALLMVVYGFRISRRLLTASSPVLQMSLGVIYAAIPVSGLYMLLHGLLKLMPLLRTREAGERDEW